MTYLPNSIERCTPIVGFDPYAFIMDAPSNLTINKMQSPYDVDYYATGPKNTTENPSADTPKKKRGGIYGALKIAAAAVSVAAIGVLAFRFKNRIGKIFHIKSSTGNNTGKIGKFFKDIQTRAKDGFNQLRKNVKKLARRP